MTNLFNLFKTDKQISKIDELMSLPTVDGNVITKWEKEFVIEVEISKRQTVYKIRTVNIF